MDQLAGQGDLPPQSGREGSFHRHGRGSYKHLRGNQDDWFDSAYQMPEPPGGISEPLVPPWFSRNQTQTSISSSSPAKGGFMLATNISNTQQQFPSSSNLPPSLAPHVIPPTNPSISSNHKEPPTAPPMLWGELESKEGEEGEKEEALRPLWQEGWRAEGLVCSLPQLHQHLPAPQSRDERNR